jgi:RNA recognition motif-containing protein
MNIYVGNLSNDASEADLRQAFEAFGQVSSATVIKDRFSGESRGFGFVEMPDKGEAQAALAGLNGQDLKGRSLKISEARPKQDRGDRDGGGGGGRRGGGDRGGDRGGRRPF